MVANMPSSLYVQNEFGKVDDVGGLFKIIPLETNLQVSFSWVITEDEFFETEKIVSLPLGPNEWAWQVMYLYLN